MQKVETSKAMLPGESPYSQAIIANGFVFTQGVICLTPDGNLLEGPFEDQLKQVLYNLKEILHAAGTSLDKVVKTTIYVTDLSTYREINEIYTTFMTEPYPARETVCVKELPLGATVEISMIATLE